MERVRIGIAGLDELLNGGIPKSSQVFLVGGPGTGKTMMGIEYLYRGAKNGETGLFFSLEEEPAWIIRNVESTFSEWKDFRGLVDSGKIQIAGHESYIHLEKAVAPGQGGAQYAFSKVLSSIQSLITNNGVTRVTIDSATVIKMFFESDLEFRRTLLNLLKSLKKLNCTTLITDEFPSLERGNLIFAAEHFVADGLLMLYNLQQQEKRLSAVEVLKMRSTAHSKALTPLKITSAGINVYVGEKVY